jgi:transposase
MPLYCGIDLHSTNSYVAVIDETFRPQLQQRVRNDLVSILEVLEPYREDLVGIAVESTYNWYWLVDGLQDTRYRCHLVNPSAVQQYSGLKYSDDRHDARWLARLLALDILPEGYIYPREERGVRDLLRRRAFLVRKRGALELSIQGLYQNNTSQRLSCAEMRGWRGSQIPPCLGDPHARMAVTALGSVASVATEQIKRIEKSVLEVAKLREEFQLLRTIGGVGPILALTIMYEVGHIERFAEVGNFISYCRLARSEHLSNGKKKGSGNRRNGNAYLSWAYSEAAEFARRYEPRARRYYDKKRACKHPMVARRSLASKIARASYYVMRDQVAFDPKRAFA